MSADFPAAVGQNPSERLEADSCGPAGQKNQPAAPTLSLKGAVAIFEGAGSLQFFHFF